MKHYSNHKYLVRCLAILTVCSLISCKKYLSVEPDSSFSVNYVFTRPNDAYKAVLGAYSCLAGDMGWGSRLNYFYANDNDELLGGFNNSSGGGDNGIKELARYNASPTNTQLAPVYNQLYQGIERANNCIKYIPLMAMYENGSTAETLELRRLHGEALVLRSQFYFDLIKNWGDVPASYVPAADLADLNLPKTNRDSIYDHLLEDLKLAITLLPWRGESGVAVDERVTKGTAKGLRARIALFRGGYSLRKSRMMERPSDYLKFYQIAKDECKELMESGKHDLNPDYKALFKDVLNAHKIEPNGEVLFEVAMAGGTGLTDSRMAMFDGIKAYGKGSPQIIIVPTYFYSFDPNDVRRDVTTAFYSINNDGTTLGNAYWNTMGITFAKFRRDWISNPAVPNNSDAGYFGLNWPLLRYADVLLMFAEADNELNNGPTADGIAAFQKVRLRGFLGDASKIGVVPVDKAGFFKAIVDERSFELGGEAVRKYDLIRWNLLNTKLQETKANLTKMRLGQAPYDQIPTRLFYLNKSQVFTISNSLYSPAPATVPAGYTAFNWRSAVNQDFINQLAEKFVPNQKELRPLPETARTSNPNLSQDYGY